MDEDEQAQLYQEAERTLLNNDIGVIPIVWCRGDYAYSDDLANFEETNFGLILWEKVSFKDGSI